MQKFNAEKEQHEQRVRDILNEKKHLQEQVIKSVKHIAEQEKNQSKAQKQFQISDEYNKKFTADSRKTL